MMVRKKGMTSETTTRTMNPDKRERRLNLLFCVSDCGAKIFSSVISFLTHFAPHLPHFFV